MKGKTALKEIDSGMESSDSGWLTQKKSASRHDRKALIASYWLAARTYQLFLRWASRASVCSSKDAKPA